MSDNSMAAAAVTSAGRPPSSNLSLAAGSRAPIPRERLDLFRAIASTLTPPPGPLVLATVVHTALPLAPVVAHTPVKQMPSTMPTPRPAWHVPSAMDGLHAPADVLPAHAPTRVVSNGLVIEPLADVRTVPGIASGCDCSGRDVPPGEVASPCAPRVWGCARSVSHICAPEWDGE